MSAIRDSVLRMLYRCSSFPIKADLEIKNSVDPDLISCVLCVSFRPDDLDLLLQGLCSQVLKKARFEVVIINDGAGDVIRVIVDKYRSKLNIVYKEHPQSKKIIGLLRNETIELAHGEYFIFLDDDTRIIQNNFIEKAWELFKENTADVIIPLGQATFGISKIKYDFFDPYSFGNAGVLYTRAILNKVGGFRNDLKAYEDIELGIRLTIVGARMKKTDQIVYLHPPFYFDSMRKPISIGQAILQLRKSYSFIVWMLVFINALRFLPYGIIPNIRLQQWYKISLGVLFACFKKEEQYY